MYTRSTYYTRSEYINTLDLILSFNGDSNFLPCLSTLDLAGDSNESYRGPNGRCRTAEELTQLQRRNMGCHKR